MPKFKIRAEIFDQECFSVEAPDEESALEKVRKELEDAHIDYPHIENVHPYIVCSRQEE